MFNMTPETFRTAFHTNAKFMVDMNRRAVDTQLAALKQGEKLAMEGMEMNRKSLESVVELQKASWNAWLDMLAPKAESK